MTAAPVAGKREAPARGLGRPPSDAQVRRLLGPARPGWEAVLGGRAVAAGLASALPERLKVRLRAAPVYPEGRAIRLALRSARGVPDVERLLALKLGR